MPTLINQPATTSNFRITFANGTQILPELTRAAVKIAYELGQQTAEVDLRINLDNGNVESSLREFVDNTGRQVTITFVDHTSGDIKRSIAFSQLSDLEATVEHDYSEPTQLIKATVRFGFDGLEILDFIKP